MFLPHVPSLMDLAGEMERERDHVIGRGEKDGDGLDDSLLDAAEREEKASDELTEEEGKFEALSSVAHFDKVVFEGREFGQLAVPGTEEEQEFIGLPACSSRSTCTTCCCSARSGSRSIGRCANPQSATAGRVRSPSRCTAR